MRKRSFAIWKIVQMTAMPMSTRTRGEVAAGESAQQRPGSEALA